MTCTVCGREMQPRKSWTSRGQVPLYCSDACRKARKQASSQGAVLEEAIRTALASRARDATVCPSEVARAVAGDDEDAWRPLMEPVRQAARRMIAGGELEMTQHGHVVDPSHAKGPVRLRRPRP